MNVVNLNEWRVARARSQASALAAVGRQAANTSVSEPTAEALWQQGCAIDEAMPAAAERIYKRALAIDARHIGVLCNLGNVLFRQRRLTQAETAFRRALRVDRDHAESNYNLGYLLFERGKAKLAIKYFERALATDPNFGDALFNLAHAYQSIGLTRKAWPLWQRYLLADRNPASEWRGDAIRNLERCTRGN